MITTEHCATGRLRDAYPVGRHDLELRVEGEPPDRWDTVLRAESDRLLVADSACRRVVFAAPAGDLAVVAAAERAGFRYVVDVDVRDGEDVLALSLLVREPEHVTRVGTDLDAAVGSPRP